MEARPLTYLNNGHGAASWLLTKDHKRIAILYLVSITAFFVIGGLFAMMVRLELLTPEGDLMAAEIYNKMFTMHGVVMVFFFLIPSIPAVLGNFLLPIMIVLSVVGAVSLTVGGAGAANIVALLFGLGLGSFMLWFYPLATVHMTQEYTYKAWILWELLKIGLRNFGPAVYYFIIAIVSAIPVAIVLVPIALLVRGVPTATPFSQHWCGGLWKAPVAPGRTRSRQ